MKNYLKDDPEVCQFVQDRIFLTAGRIQKCGSEWRMRCPICGDSRKDLTKMRGSYYLKRNIYRCWNEGCSASGLWIIAKFENRDISEIKREFVEWLASTGKLGAPKNSFATLSGEITNAPKVVDTAKQDDRLTKIVNDWTDLPRSVEYNIKNERKLYSAPFYPKDLRLRFDAKTCRLVIPWYRGKELRFYQTRAIRKNDEPKYDSAHESTGLVKDVFNFDMLDECVDEVYALEGAFDAVWVKNGCAIAGSTVTEHQLEIFDQKPNFKLVYMFDNQYKDLTGLKKTLKMFEERPSALGFVWPRELSKFKDVNEVAVSSPADAAKFVDPQWLRSRVFSGIRGILELEKAKELSGL